MESLDAAAGSGLVFDAGLLTPLLVATLLNTSTIEVEPWSGPLSTAIRSSDMIPPSMVVAAILSPLTYSSFAFPAGIECVGRVPACNVAISRPTTKFPAVLLHPAVIFPFGQHQGSGKFRANPRLPSYSGPRLAKELHPTHAYREPLLWVAVHVKDGWVLRGKLPRSGSFPRFLSR
jgi:hypothetical protein